MQRSKVHRLEIADMHIRNQALEQQYAIVPFPLGHSVFKYAAERFLDFLNLPEEIKRELHFKADAHRSSAEGYTDKRKEAGKDPKEFFHWRPKLKDHPAYQTLEREVGAVQAFFAAAENIYHYAERVSHDLLLAQFPELYEHSFENGQLVRGFLRFLCYTPTHIVPDRIMQSAEGDGIYEIGGGHYDKSNCTLALAESAPGLRIGCCADHPLKRVEHREHEAIFMPGWLVYKYTNECIIPAWHDVWHSIQCPHLSPQCVRWAIVFFVDDKTGYYPEWKEVHTPLRVH